MLETKNYWILDNKFIFKPKFNSSIDTYYNLISNCDELIFSNYDDINSCIETNNCHEHDTLGQFPRVSIISPTWSLRAS